MINFQAGAGQVCRFILINSFVLINAKEQSVGIQLHQQEPFRKEPPGICVFWINSAGLPAGEVGEASNAPYLLLSFLVLTSLIIAIKST